MAPNNIAYGARFCHSRSWSTGVSRQVPLSTYRHIRRSIRLSAGSWGKIPPVALYPWNLKGDPEYLVRSWPFLWKGGSLRLLMMLFGMEEFLVEEEEDSQLKGERDELMIVSKSTNRNNWIPEINATRHTETMTLVRRILGHQASTFLFWKQNTDKIFMRTSMSSCFVSFFVSQVMYICCVSVCFSMLQIQD